MAVWGHSDKVKIPCQNVDYFTSRLDLRCIAEIVSPGVNSMCSIFHFWGGGKDRLDHCCKQPWPIPVIQSFPFVINKAAGV